MKAALGICIASFIGCMAAMWWFPPPECPDRTLCGEFKHVSGHAYYVPFIAAFFTYDGEAGLNSTAELYEDGVKLGPAHSDFESIEAKGHGRYVYWGNGMLRGFYISASDNSDPNTNGRTYTVRDPGAVDPYLPANQRGPVAAYERPAP